MWLYKAGAQEVKPLMETLSEREPAFILLLSSQVPVIWDHIVSENSGKWRAIAKHQVNNMFSPSEEELRSQACR